MNSSRDNVDRIFRKLEVELSLPFSEEKTEALWGGGMENVGSGGTVEAPGCGDGGQAVRSRVRLVANPDGTASMSIPGASVALSRRRVSSEPGAEYEVGETLGKGGMGVVTIARQASLDRRVIVKSICPEYTGYAEAQEKFITEALATGSLDHPNVVPVHDMGIGAGGELFYVMKEVKGSTWRELLPTLSEAENIEILQHVSDAVAYAHDKGIIHRDLKPGNVMIGDYGEVLVMDWGLAAAVTPDAKAAQLTDASACAGTPAFMAPEMARGLARDLGPWTDQYLLGGILFAILTGAPPHSGANAREGLNNAANNALRPTTRADNWMKVALRAMATAPHKRYPSVKEFQKALRNCQAHAESIALARRGEAFMAKAEAGIGYDDYGRAIFAFEQALDLWERNIAVLSRLAEARLACANRAFEKGDYDLALSLMKKHSGPAEAELARKAGYELRQRESRNRLVRVLGIAAAGALLLVTLVAGAATVAISQRAESEHRARSEAEAALRSAEAKLRLARETHRRTEESRREWVEMMREWEEENRDED